MHFLFFFCKLAVCTLYISADSKFTFKFFGLSISHLNIIKWQQQQKKGEIVVKVL